MTEKTEVEIQKEIEAVQSMKLAKSNMERAISRANTLESRLRKLIEDVKYFKGFVPRAAHLYNSEKSLHERMDEAMVYAGKVLL